jgi:HEAT repeat protein
MKIAAALEALNSANLEVRQRAVERFANEPEGLGSEFFARIYETNDDPICKWYAIRALGDLGAKEYLGLLIDVLSKPDVNVGKSSLHLIAARSIGQIGPPALHRLLSLLENAEGETAIAVVDALGEIGAAEAVPALARTLQSRTVKLAGWCALSLAKIGRPSIPALVDCLVNADHTLAYIIIDALAIIDDPEVMPGLAEAGSRFPNSVKQYTCHGPQDRIQRLMSLVHTTSTHHDSLAFAARRFLSVLGQYN